MHVALASGQTAKREPLFYLFYLGMHCIIPFGKIGPPYLGKPTAATRAALPNPFSAYWVFSRFLNAPNSDKDYRILTCVRFVIEKRIH